MNASDQSAERGMRKLTRIGAVAALLLASLATPARADDPGPQFPEARLQIFVHHFFIADDGDWHSSGEIRASVEVYECADTACNDANFQSPLVTSNLAFSADSGTFPAINRVVPGGDDDMDHGTTARFGLPLSEDKQYGLFFSMREDDGFLSGGFDPAALSLAVVLASENNWSVGRHERPVGNSEASGRVNFTVRYVDLPDLVPVSVKVLEIPGSADSIVCAGVENRGTEAPGPFQVAMYLQEPPTPLGTAMAGTLAPGATGDLCVTVALPRTALNSLVAVVDEPRGIFEQNEQNNRFEQRFTAIRPGLGSVISVNTVGGPAESVANPQVVKPEAASPARLAVEQIRVRGKNPDGQSDCDPGANEVRVTVKNTGTAASAAFSVKLEVDDDGAGQNSLPALGAGASVETSFSGVQLKKGDRRIKVSVELDPGSSSEKNDAIEKSLRVSCEEKD